MITYYQSIWEGQTGQLLEFIEIFSDGCASQNKSRFVVSWVSRICDQFNLKGIVWTWAPTANFKCACDACGSDTKRFYRRYEASGLHEHCYNAYMVYKLMRDNMSVPNQNKSLMHISQRFHRYVYCEEQVKPLNIDQDDPNTILINNSAFYANYNAVAL